MSFNLIQQEGETLIRLARRTVEHYLKTKQRLPIPQDLSKNLMRKCGVFVTINGYTEGDKQLRGCIGIPYPMLSLAEATMDSAINAATGDPRFPPLKLEEINEVVFEVSVLTLPEKIETGKPIDYPSKIRVGEHGLIVERGMCKGLLLPQVPVEWKWDEHEFLSQCCMKAGLQPDQWLVKGTTIYTFKAIVFEEETPKGNIIRKSLDRK